ITSGALSYAVGAGAAVISTPYWHAQELLEDGRGRFFDFGQHTQLAKLVADLLGHPEQIDEMKDRAYDYGLSLRWPIIGQTYAKLFYLCAGNHKLLPNKGQDTTNSLEIPSFLPPFRPSRRKGIRSTSTG